MNNAPLAAALEQAAAVLETLSPDELDDLASGRGRLVFHRASNRPTRRPTAPRPPATGVVEAAVEEINRLTTPAEVAAYLERNDAQFTVPVLKEIARGLGPTVSSAGRNKTEIRRNIVEGTAGFRTRTAAMSGGAWS
jgi:hypothetical protein